MFETAVAPHVEGAVIPSAEFGELARAAEAAEPAPDIWEVVGAKIGREKREYKKEIVLTDLPEVGDEVPVVWEKHRELQTDRQAIAGEGRAFWLLPATRDSVREAALSSGDQRRVTEMQQRDAYMTEHGLSHDDVRGMFASAREAKGRMRERIETVMIETGASEAEAGRTLDRMDLMQVESELLRRNAIRLEEEVAEQLLADGVKDVLLSGEVGIGTADKKHKALVGIERLVEQSRQMRQDAGAIEASMVAQTGRVLVEDEVAAADQLEVQREKEVQGRQGTRVELGSDGEVLTSEVIEGAFGVLKQRIDGERVRLIDLGMSLPELDTKKLQESLGIEVSEDGEWFVSKDSPVRAYILANSRREAAKMALEQNMQALEAGDAKMVGVVFANASEMVEQEDVQVVSGNVSLEEGIVDLGRQALAEAKKSGDIVAQKELADWLELRGEQVSVRAKAVGKAVGENYQAMREFLRDGRASDLLLKLAKMFGVAMLAMLVATVVGTGAVLNAVSGGGR